jgi:hypothetical protein
MKLTIKMKASKAWNRRYDYIVMRGNEVIAVCTDLKSATTIKHLQTKSYCEGRYSSTDMIL